MTKTEKSNKGEGIREERVERSKKASKEEKRQILFMEFFGDLIGIDLNRYGNRTPPDSHSPPPAPVCCRLELRKHYDQYPRGMRYAKIGHKHYLLGGVFFDPTASHILLASKPYSRGIYEFDPNNLLTGGDIDIFLGPTDILRLSSSSSICDGKTVHVVNISGTLYLFHYWDPLIPFIPNNRAPIERLANVDPPSWVPVPAPTPRFSEPFVDSPDIGGYMGANHPATFHFVVDHTWVILCHEPHMYMFALHYLTHPHGVSDGDSDGGGLWKTMSDDGLEGFATSFKDICGIDVLEDPPTVSLSLPNLSLKSPLCPAFGVLLILRDHAVAVAPSPFSQDTPPSVPANMWYSFIYTLKAYALAMSNTTFQVKFCQELDVFDGMFPTSTPFHFGDNFVYHLLDLGEGGDDDDDTWGEGEGEGEEKMMKKNTRKTRVAAILITPGLPHETAHLFVSIFDLSITDDTTITAQMDSDCPPAKCDFLVLTPVKKLVFSFDLYKKELSAAYQRNESSCCIHDIPPLDVFIV